MKRRATKYNALSLAVMMIAGPYSIFTHAAVDGYGNPTPTADETGRNYTAKYLENGENPYFKPVDGVNYFVNPSTGVTDMQLSNIYTGFEISNGSIDSSLMSDDYTVSLFEGNNVSNNGNGTFTITSIGDPNDSSKNAVVFYKNYAEGVVFENDSSSLYMDSNNADGAQINNKNNGYINIKQNSAMNAEMNNDNSKMDVVGNNATGAVFNNTNGGYIYMTENTANDAIINNDSGTIDIINNTANDATLNNSAGTMNVVDNTAEGAYFNNTNGGTFNMVDNRASNVTIKNNENSLVNVVGNDVSGANITNSGSMTFRGCTVALGCKEDGNVIADNTTAINYGYYSVLGGMVYTNSSFENYGTTDVTGYIDFTDTTVTNAGTLNITDGFDLTNGTVNNTGVMNVSGTGNYSMQIKNESVMNIASNSNITATSDLVNTGSVNIGDAVTYSGDIDNKGKIFIGDVNSTSPTTFDYKGTLTNNGDIYLTHAFDAGRTSAPVGNVLNVDGDLNGNGTYYMLSQVSDQTNDLINVTGAINGNNTLFVKDTGSEPTPTENLTLVKSGQAGTGSFALNGDKVDIGTYRYGLEKQGNDWVLANNGKSEASSLSTGANAAVGMHSATASMWEEEMGTLMNRMGDLRLDNNHVGGVWVRQLSHEIHASPDSSRSYKQRYNGTQIGVDKAFGFNGGVFYLGAMTGFSRSTLDFNEGANGSIKSQTYGLYGTALFDNGYYLDTVAKYGHMKNKIDYHDNAGNKVKGHYTSNALGLSVEGGKRFTFEDGWFIEPQLQLTASHLRGRSYSLSNGMEVKSNSMDLFNGRAGVVAGTKMTFDQVVVEPYVEVSHVQELSGTGRVVVNNNRLDSDQVGTRQRYSFGANFNVAKQHNFFVNASYENGSKMEQPWGVKAGYQFRF